MDPSLHPYTIVWVLGCTVAAVTTESTIKDPSSSKVARSHSLSVHSADVRHLLLGRGIMDTVLWFVSSDRLVRSGRLRVTRLVQVAQLESCA